MQSESNIARPSPGVSLPEAVQSNTFLAHVGEWLLEAATLSEQRRLRIDDLQTAANEEREKRQKWEREANEQYAKTLLHRNECARLREALSLVGAWVDRECLEVPVEVHRAIEGLFPDLAKLAVSEKVSLLERGMHLRVTEGGVRVVA